MSQISPSIRTKAYLQEEETARGVAEQICKDLNENQDLNFFLFGSWDPQWMEGPTIKKPGPEG